MCLIKSIKISFAFFFTFCYSLLWSLLSFLEDGVFTFTLKAYEDDAHTTPVPDPVALDVEIYFKAEVKTQSATPSLDLYPVRCYSSKNRDPSSSDGKFTIITNG